MGSAAFVNQYICLRHEADVNHVTQACGMEGDIPSGGFRGQCPGRACGSNLGLFPPAVVEEGKRVDEW
jgi:hypothetical protein